MTPTPPRDSSEYVEHVERVREALIDQGWPPERVPASDYIEAHVEQAREYISTGNLGWSVVARAIETIKHAREPETCPWTGEP